LVAIGIVVHVREMIQLSAKNTNTTIYTRILPEDLVFIVI